LNSTSKILVGSLPLVKPRHHRSHSNLLNGLPDSPVLTHVSVAAFWQRLNEIVYSLCLLIFLPAAPKSASRPQTLFRLKSEIPEERWHLIEAVARSVQKVVDKLVSGIISNYWFDFSTVVSRKEKLRLFISHELFTFQMQAAVSRFRPSSKTLGLDFSILYFYAWFRKILLMEWKRQTPGGLNLLAVMYTSGLPLLLASLQSQSCRRKTSTTL
jgi:hypothetical protein